MSSHKSLTFKNSRVQAAALLSSLEVRETGIIYRSDENGVGVRLRKCCKIRGGGMTEKKKSENFNFFKNVGAGSGGAAGGIMIYFYRCRLNPAQFLLTSIFEWTSQKARMGINWRENVLYMQLLSLLAGRRL